MKTNNEIESSSTSSNLLTGDVELAQERLDELKQTVQAERGANQKLYNSVAGELDATPEETNEIVDSIVASAAEQLDAIATGDPEGFKAIVDAANQVGVDTDEVARELREREGRLNAAGITKELLEMAERAEAQEPGYVFYNPRELAERRGRILEAAKKLDSENPLEIFEQALKNVSPSFEVKSRRVGGANYQIPFPVQGHRQLHYAFSWLVQSARARSGMPYSQRLALEIVDAYNETGAAFKKKEDTHKMAEANRAFAHFARG